MTKAIFQPFCRANNNNIGYVDGIRVFPRNVTEQNMALYLHIDLFCLIWKSKGVSFEKFLKN